MTAPKADQPAKPAARRRKPPASLMGKAAEVTAPLPRQHAHIGAQLDREFPALATATIPVAPVPKFLTEADRDLPWTHLRQVDQAIETFWADADKGWAAVCERVFGPLDAWLAVRDERAAAWVPSPDPS